jgi:hypothetical protein
MGSTYQSIVIDAAPEQVWEAIRDFHDTSWTPNVISSDEAPSPISSAEISDYLARVTVKPTPDGAGTMVEWSSNWQNNDDAGYEFCHPIYVALLNDMKASLERSS